VTPTAVPVDGGTSFGTSTGRNRRDQADGGGLAGLVTDWLDSLGRFPKTYDIFEGTEQIRQLVVARALSGLRIE
jgi:hypothetical protein